MKVAFIAFTRTGFELMHEIAVRFAVESERIGDDISLTTTKRLAEEMGLDSYDDLGEWTRARFSDSDAIVFVGATGIAVRAIAPCVEDKFRDPAVVCLDERGRVVVPLLSGHVGGANDLARELASYTGGIAAVSTATDVEGLFSVDEWARKHGMAILERDVAKEVSAALLEGEPVGYVSQPGGGAGAGTGGDRRPRIGVCVGPDADARPFERTLHLVPRTVTVGVGCKRGTDPAALEERARQVLASHAIAPQAVRAVASIDAKRDEPAVQALAQALGCPAVFFSADELNAVEGTFGGSDFVRETVGTDNVCERAAAATGGRLVVPKQAGGGMTVAIGEDDFRVEAPEGLVSLEGGATTAAGNVPAPGRLSIVGLGPGAQDDMTRRAYRTLEDCDAIVGYTVYIDLLKREFPGKPLLATPMRREVERCEMALERAARGEHVAMVCSGDPGVYGMAGLCYELVAGHGQDYAGVELDVVPGVSAANGGAAVLGAPLMHDFCVVSLSDLLTPWDKIERRLAAAAAADFVVCLYNPSSKKRADYLQRACDILLAHKAPETVCGTVRNIGREGEEHELMTLAELRAAKADMFTTVFVGNESTRVIDGHMVTPRGYLQHGRG